MRHSVAIPFLAVVLLAAPAGVSAESILTVEELANRLGMTRQNDATTCCQTLTDGVNRLVICPGMHNVLVNDTLVAMNSRACLKFGEVIVPESAFALLRGHLGGSSARPLPAPLSPSAFKVAIDPGHGGKDPGAIGCYGVKEKTVNLAIGLELRRLLRSKNIDVVMTREDDTFVSLDDRPAIANREQCDVFISIHANASRSGSTNGFETFYVEDRGPYSTIARGIMAARVANPAPRAIGSELVLGSLAKAIVFSALMEEYRVESYELAQCVQSSLGGRLSTENRGAKTDHPLRVLRKSHCPGVLVEVGFVTHAPSAQRMQRDAHLREIANGIADGIMKFVERSSTTRRFTR